MMFRIADSQGKPPNRGKPTELTCGWGRRIFLVSDEHPLYMDGHKVGKKGDIAHRFLKLFVAKMSRGPGRLVARDLH